MKHEKNETADAKIASFAKALSHPTRVAIVRALIDKGSCGKCGCPECNCGENCPGENCRCGCKCGTLVDLFPMAQSTISRHIKELTTAGIVTMNGRKGNYTLNRKAITQGITLITELLTKNITDMEENKKCNCGENCQCGDNCNCGENCQCGENCNCCEECKCGDDCRCTEDAKCCDTCTCG